MKRPYSYIMMNVTLNGKVSGPAFATKATDDAAKDLTAEGWGEGSYYNATHWLWGRKTTQEMCGLELDPTVDDSAEVEPGDYIADPDAKAYLISLDAHGRLAWNQSTAGFGDLEGHIVEVLNNEVGNGYKDYLRKRGISYIVAGPGELDLALAMQKCRELLGIDRLLIFGGGTINWAFIEQGLCDEVSLFMAPAADAEPDTTPVFAGSTTNNPGTPVEFELKEAKPMDGGVVWLRYMPKNVTSD